MTNDVRVYLKTVGFSFRFNIDHSVPPSLRTYFSVYFRVFWAAPRSPCLSRSEPSSEQKGKPTGQGRKIGVGRPKLYDRYFPSGRLCHTARFCCDGG